MPLLRHIRQFFRRTGPPQAAQAEGGRVEDRRRAPRVPHAATLVLAQWTGHAPRQTIPIVLRDFSETGIGVAADQPLDPGECYALWLPGQSTEIGTDGVTDAGSDAGTDADGGTDPRVIVCRVARCWSDRGGRFAAGLEFLYPVPLSLLWQAVRFGSTEAAEVDRPGRGSPSGDEAAPVDAGIEPERGDRGRHHHPGSLGR